jgi:predicted secreted protein
MTTGAFVAQGTAVTWNTAAVPEILNLSGPSNTASEIDVTNFDSTGAYKEYLMGLLDGGEITAECNFIPSNSVVQAIIADYAARTARAWTITFADTGSAVLGGNGYIKSYGVSAPIEGQVKFSFTIRVTGAVTLTP